MTPVETVAFNVLFDDCEEEAEELVKCLEESNRPQHKALLYIFLGKWISALQAYLDLAWPSKRSVLNNKLQCAIRLMQVQRIGALEFIFAEWTPTTYNACLSRVFDDTVDLWLTVLAFCPLLKGP